MKPINAAIFIKGLDNIDKQTPVENFSFTTLVQVKARLKELQKKAYCNEGERVRIKAQEYNRQGKAPVKTIEAYSDCDFSHIAYLGMKIKTLPEGK